MKQELTEWYPPNIKPFREGVYLVTNAFFANWNGRFWGCIAKNPKTAALPLFADVQTTASRKWKGVLK